MEYISLSWSDIPEHVVPIRISLIECCYEQEATDSRVPIGWAEFITSKAWRRHHGLVYRYRIAVSQMTTDMYYLSYTLSVLSSSMTYHRICIYHDTTSGPSGEGTPYPSGAHEFTHGFQRGLCCSIFSFMCNVFGSLFVLFYFFFSPLIWLFFVLRILITPFVSLYYSSVTCIGILGS